MESANPSGGDVSAVHHSALPTSAVLLYWPFKLINPLHHALSLAVFCSVLFHSISISFYSLLCFDLFFSCSKNSPNDAIVDKSDYYDNDHDVYYIIIVILFTKMLAVRKHTFNDGRKRICLPRLPSFNHSHSLIQSLTYSLTHWLTHWLTCQENLPASLTFVQSLPLTHSITHSFNHSLTHWLTHSLTHLPGEFACLAHLRRTGHGHHSEDLRGEAILVPYADELPQSIRVARSHLHAAHDVWLLAGEWVSEWVSEWVGMVWKSDLLKNMIWTTGGCRNHTAISILSTY